MTTLSPQRAANELTVVLRAAGVADFPVDVESVALEISAQKYPDDPIRKVVGGNIPGFEGALAKSPGAKNGWGIIYNTAITSKGRINFTLGHELGHYVLHRKHYPEGINCNAEDMANWGSEYGQREHEANLFAATLLMPLDDFRGQIESRARPNFEQIGYCADRYGVSLTAAILRWLQYTTRRSMLVVSRDGFILWARASKSALSSGLYYKTRGRPPIEVPAQSLVSKARKISGSVHSADHDAIVWLSQACTEHLLVSDQYDFNMSLLHFGNAAPRFDDCEEQEEDTATRIRSRNPGQSWLN